MSSLACPLTPCQFEVMRSLCAGESQNQIAHRLVVAKTTVRSHAHDAYKRLGVSTVSQAVAVMFREGWLEPDDLLSDYEGPAYTTESQRFKINWVPSPAQRLYLDAFDRLLAERSDEAAEHLDRCFAVMCGERGVPDRRRINVSIDSMLLKVGRALIARDVPMAREAT